MLLERHLGQERSLSSPLLDLLLVLVAAHHAAERLDGRAAMLALLVCPARVPAEPSRCSLTAPPPRRRLGPGLRLLLRLRLQRLASRARSPPAVTVLRSSSICYITLANFCPSAALIHSSCSRSGRTPAFSSLSHSFCTRLHRLAVGVDVVAVGVVAAGDQHHRRAAAEGLEDHLLRDTGRAHGAHHPVGGRVLDARDAGHVAAGVGAPVAGEDEDLVLGLLGQDGPDLGDELLVGEVAHGDGAELAARRRRCRSRRRPPRPPRRPRPSSR